MAFSREDLKAYESQPAAPAPETAPPAAEPTPAAPEASSAESVPTDPAVPESDVTSGEQAESPPAAADSDSETPAEPQDQDDGPPKGSRARERIEELVAERNALRKYGEHLLATVAELKGATTPAPAAAAPAAATPAASTAPPSLEDFGYDQVAFSKAQTEWVQQEVARQVKANLEAARAENDSVSAREKFLEREAKVKATLPDFETVTAKNPAFPKLEQAAADMIVRSEIGPQIAYHLGKNPDVATRISRMNAEGQKLAIARLEGQLTVTPPAAPAAAAAPKTQPKPKSVTSAPPPPTPTPAGSAGPKDIASMTMDEWVAQERAKKMAQREQSLKIRRAMR